MRESLYLHTTGGPSSFAKGLVAKVPLGNAPGLFKKKNSSKLTNILNNLKILHHGKQQCEHEQQQSRSEQ